MELDSLIKIWEDTAERYEKKAREHINITTAERLFSAAETFKLCADQLKRRMKNEIH